MGQENEEHLKETTAQGSAAGHTAASAVHTASPAVNTASQRPVPPDHQLPPAPNQPPSGSSRGSRWLWWIIVLLVIAGIYFAYRFFSGSAPQKSDAAAKGKGAGSAAITVGQSTKGNMNIYVDALGTVTPTNTVTVYSQVTGRVIAVHYREGQMVLKGDPLIDVDPRPYQATLAQAQGSLAHDQAVLAEARIDLKRYVAADAQNAIAKQQLEDQEQTVIQNEGTVKADEGTVAYDQVQLEYCHIVAPITGRVGLRLVDPGNTIFSGSSATLVVITQLQPITVVFNVSEDDLPQVQAQLHGTHRLAVDAFDRADVKKIEAGTLASFDNQVDTTTGTVKFRADFPNKHLELFPNQFVNARLLVNTLRNVTLVPSAAVQHNGTSAFVYLVKPGNTVAVQQIKVLTNDEKNSAVEGIDAGLEVATSGFDRLDNGAKVVVHTQNAKGKPAAGNQASGTGAP